MQDLSNTRVSTKEFQPVYSSQQLFSSLVFAAHQENCLRANC